MENITYYLGAGASYHAIPTVEGLNERMDIFHKLLQRNYILKDGEFNLQIQNLYLNEEVCNKYKALELNFDEIVQNALKHRTVDTYAKKLTLKDPHDREGNLYKLKTFLTLYFHFEQTNDDSILKINKSGHINDIKEAQRIASHYLTKLDYRYEVFLATLLQENLELPEQVHIISWNYDFQLEASHLQFSDSDDINNSLDKLKFLNPDNFKRDENARFIKLNGTALNYQTLDRKSWKNSFKSTLTFLEDIDIGTHPNLSFAWEANEYQIDVFKRAESILQETKILIIIGYSFPYFNRKIDSRILRKLPADTEIFVQCLEKDFKGIEQSLKSIFLKKQKISFYDDTSQFYIPQSLIE